MLCQNLGETTNLFTVIVTIIVGLVMATIIAYLGWVPWDWKLLGTILIVLIVVIIFGLCVVGLSPMH